VSHNTHIARVFHPEGREPPRFDATGRFRNVSAGRPGRTRPDGGPRGGEPGAHRDVGPGPAFRGADAPGLEGQPIRSMGAVPDHGAGGLVRRNQEHPRYVRSHRWAAVVRAPWASRASRPGGSGSVTGPTELSRQQAAGSGSFTEPGGDTPENHVGRHAAEGLQSWARVHVRASLKPRAQPAGPAKQEPARSGATMVTVADCAGPRRAAPHGRPDDATDSASGGAGVVSGAVPAPGGGSPASTAAGTPSTSCAT